MAAILAWISGQNSAILVTEHNLWHVTSVLLCCRALRHPHSKVQCLFLLEGGSGSQFAPPTHYSFNMVELFALLLLESQISYPA